MLNVTITNAADIANIPKSSNIRPLKNKRKSNHKQNKKWFEKECRAIYKNVKLIANKIRKEPYNRPMIAELNHCRNVYKRTIQSKKQQFTSNIISELESLQYQSPKCFWDLAKCLNFNNKNNEQISKNI